jgi:hypothetical protein
MESIYDLLSPIEVKLDQLLLDPNNPRFSELGEEVDQVPESRFSESKVQRHAYDNMKKPRFEVTELRETIKEIGFLPMDRIVVRQWKNTTQENKIFVVIEGNRRVTALKWLIELHEAGKETLTDNQIINFKNLRVLLLDDLRAPASVRWIIPGLRHVSGIKEWGAFQKARAVYELRETGKTAPQAAQSLGLSTVEANRLWRSYLALNQMINDEEYKEYAQPRLYSYFEEALRKANVKDWLGWNDIERKFTHEDHIQEFYSWMIPETNDNGETSLPKLPEAKSVRELSRFIEDARAMAAFRATDGSLSRANAIFESEHKEDWLPMIASAKAVLLSLSPETLRKMKSEEIESINSLRKTIDQVLKDRKKLLGKKNG